jgi:predicted tellurium resistance membrane protein TerC
MSLDNVIGVAAAAKGSLVLLIFGLVVSIPLVIVGSQLIMKAIERFPILVIAGGGLLGYVAGEMAVTDTAVADWVNANAHWMHWVVPTACIALVVGLARLLKMRSERPGETPG